MSNWLLFEGKADGFVVRVITCRVIISWNLNFRASECRLGTELFTKVIVLLLPLPFPQLKVTLVVRKIHLWGKEKNSSSLPLPQSCKQQISPKDHGGWMDYSKVSEVLCLDLNLTSASSMWLWERCLTFLSECPLDAGIEKGPPDTIPKTRTEG